MSKQAPIREIPPGKRSNGRVARCLCLAIFVSQGMFSRRLQPILILTTMAIGAMGLAATIFIGNGALHGLWSDLDQLLGNRVIVAPAVDSEGKLLRKRNSEELTLEDLAYVRQHVPDAMYVSPFFYKYASISLDAQVVTLPVEGIEKDLEADPYNRPLEDRIFSEEGRTGQTWECMLSISAAKFLGIDLKKQPTVFIDRNRFSVVAIVPDVPGFEQDLRMRVVIPYFAAYLMWGKPRIVDSILVAWKSPQQMETTIAALTKALDECRVPGAYSLSSSQFKIKKRKNIIGNFMVFGTVQSIFCILVASLGVVNVMLANVVRRTREFAIRIVMGARHRDIAMVVLLESAALGFLGGTIGILIAVLVSEPLCSMLSYRISEASQLQPIINLKGILLPLAVCTTSGLIAGIIPAIRARALDILAVIRAE